MGIILYGMLLGNLYAYREQYTNIGVTFAVTVVMKTIMKGAGAKDDADIFAIGGGALTLGEVVKLLKAMTTGGFGGGEAGKKISGGLVGTLLESAKDLIGNK